MVDSDRRETWVPLIAPSRRPRPVRPNIRTTARTMMSCWPHLPTPCVIRVSFRFEDAFLSAFLNHPEKFLNVHVDRTQRRRNYPSSLKTHHTEIYVHPHTRTQASTHAHSLDTQVRGGGSNPRRQPPILGSCHWATDPSASLLFLHDSIRSDGSPACTCTQLWLLSSSADHEVSFRERLRARVPVD